MDAGQNSSPGRIYFGGCQLQRGSNPQYPQDNTPIKSRNVLMSLMGYWPLSIRFISDWSLLILQWSLFDSTVRRTTGYILNDIGNLSGF
jgi:hypothetical protein